MFVNRRMDTASTLPVELQEAVQAEAEAHGFDEPAGRWIHIPWNGWNEADLRTAAIYHIYLPLVMRQ